MRPVTLTAISVLPCLTWAATIVQRQNQSLPQVNLGYSTVQATDVTYGIAAYRNIRYAAPPVGDLRWANARPPLVENVTNTGTSQSNGTLGCAVSEDCLFLDVFKPQNAAGSLPVVVWVHGGGFRVGSKNADTPSGLYLINQGFIFVAINYRLGYMGFASSPTLQESASGNVGLSDVNAAFSWVQQYISAFGGDPAQVTAFGESAGATQILMTLTRYAGTQQALFSRAFIASPALRPSLGNALAEQLWQNVSTSVGCTGGNVTCMRQASFSTVNSAASAAAARAGLTLQPRVDGQYLTAPYEYLIDTGRLNFTGSMVIGHCEHEINLLPPPSNPLAASWPGRGINSVADGAAALRAAFPGIRPEIVDKALSFYDIANYGGNYSNWYADIDQSFEFVSKIPAVNRAMRNNTWNYNFGIYPAAHTSDLPYWFYRGANEGSATNITAIDMAIAMQRYLISFVMTGDPNSMFNQTTNWPLYGSVQNILNINTTGVTVGRDVLDTSANGWWRKSLWY